MAASIAFHSSVSARESPGHARTTWYTYGGRTFTNSSSVVISSSSLNSSYLIVGGLVLVGIFLLSLGLYALDVYMTSLIDRYLLSQYGPNIYDQFTNTYDPSTDIGNIPYFAARQWKEMTATERIMGFIEAAREKFEAGGWL